MTRYGSWRGISRYFSKQWGTTAGSEATPKMLAGMPEIDNLSLGREALKEGPVVGGAVANGADPGLRAHSPDIGDLARELRHQRDLAALRHAAEIEGLQPFALGVLEGERAAGGLLHQRASARPSSPALSATVTPPSETDAVTASAGMSVALHRVSSVSGAMLSQRSCMFRVSR